MANKVTAQVAGGTSKVLDGVDTVGDVREKLDLDNTYSASVNGDPKGDDAGLSDFNYVSFAPNVKGG